MLVLVVVVVESCSFSGSVLPGSGDDYQGVGLEMFANTESFFKFRSNPSELDADWLPPSCWF